MRLDRMFWILFVCLSVGFVGCGDTEDDESQQEGATTAATTTQETSGETSVETGGGETTTTATTGGGETTGGETSTVAFPDCTYPEGATRRPSYGEVMPEISWKGAYRGNGSQVDFTIRELYCSPEYEDIETIVFFVGAGWCPNCPALAQSIYQQWAAFRDENAYLVWYEVQNDQYELASNEEAQDSIQSYIGEGGPGIRVGDANTEPTAGLLDNNRMVQAFPSMFVVRRRDMKVIAASVNSEFIFPALQVARHPEADWDNPWDNTLDTNVGEECRADEDCDGGTLITQCIGDRDPDTGERTGWNRGYCVSFGCSDDSACGEGGVCVDTGGGGPGACYAGCTEDSDCRSGYRCGGLGLGVEASSDVCRPL